MSQNEEKMLSESLSKRHDLKTFDCGNLKLNKYLSDNALASHQGDFTKTHVVIINHQVVGYYTLAAGSQLHNQVTERIARGASQQPIPIAVLARLAVDVAWQSKKIGTFLLVDALTRIELSSRNIGIRAVLVEPKNDAVKAWYKVYGFEDIPSEPMRLLLLMKDFRKSLGI